MRTYIIAEAGVNHNGSLKMAKQLVDVAAESGADAVKFQTFKAENLVSKTAAKADYQQRLTSKKESQYEMLKKLELTKEMHKILIEYCNEKNIEFLSTPFDQDSLDLLVHTYNISKIKIPSGEITNAPFLLEIAKKKKPVILSTGMSTLAEIEQALSVLSFGYINENEEPSIENFKKAYCSQEGQASLKENVILLHCTTEYPAPFSTVNLLIMDTLKIAFQLPVGFSDHSEGISVPIAAVARGAKVIEKHFTLDRSLPGPDHQASLEPSELKLMVKSIREIEKALGSPIKSPVEIELKNLTVARKSLVAKTDISIGEVFSIDNLTIKRPGVGISPYEYWELLGTVATKAYKRDELIKK